MVEKIKLFSQGDVIQIYKSIIGTLIFIAILFIGWGVDQMIKQNQRMYIEIQEQAKVDIALRYEINYNKRDINTIKSCVTKNTSEIEKIKIGM